jgi:acyl carrier protein
VEELNLQLDEKITLEDGPDTRLFGRKGVLDSLMLVNFTVALEQEIQDQFDVDITLADERALSMKKSPFYSVASLVEYAVELIEEAQK